MAGSFTQGGEGAFDVGQEEGMTLRGEMEWEDGLQEVHSRSTGRRWKDGAVRVVIAPSTGKEESGLDLDCLGQLCSQVRAVFNVSWLDGLYAKFNLSLCV